MVHAETGRFAAFLMRSSDWNFPWKSAPCITANSCGERDRALSGARERATAVEGSRDIEAFSTSSERKKEPSLSYL